MREMSNSVLMTLPDHDDLTRYVSCWSSRLLAKTAERTGKGVIVSKGSSATRSHVESNIRSKNPRFVFLNGHGTADVVFGQGDEPIVKLGENEELLRGRIVHVLACDAGKSLGPGCGAEAFIGYKGKFWLCMDKFSLLKPLEDRFARPVMVSALDAPNQMLKDMPPADAFESSQRLYQEQIDEFTHSESKYTTEELQLVLPVLFINKSLQVLCQA